MINTCTGCGDIIPEGIKFCYACTHEKIRCPECGTELSLMSSCRSYTDKQVLYSRLYNCENCNTDWEAVCSAAEPTLKLNRKFWG